MAFALALLLFSALPWWAAFYLSRKMRSERGWPTVSGEILERGVGTTPGTRIPPGASVSAFGRYYLYVKYTYSVAGKEYINDQIYLVGRTYGTGEAMKRVVNRLPNPVPVHYNPEDPAQAYLLVNHRWPVWICVAFGVGAFLLGLMQLLVELTKR